MASLFRRSSIGSAFLFAKRPVILLSIIIPATVIFLVIAARTTQRRLALALGRQGMIVCSLAALVAAQPVERAVTAPGPRRAAGRHIGRRWQGFAGRSDHSRVRADRSRREQSAGCHGRHLTACLPTPRPSEGISSVRIDKRGMFGSKRRSPTRNQVTIADYAGDAHAWIASIRQRDRRQMRLGARP